MFRILVAEDDDSARFLMCEVLRRAGYDPCPARDGLEALEVMEHYQCDLAVVDITMPRMDGITFTQTLREGNCDLPVLMVTARVTQDDKRRGFRAGTDDYMVKPVDEEEMLWRIEALLRRYCSRADRRLYRPGPRFAAGHHPTEHMAAHRQGVLAAVQAAVLPTDAFYQAAAHRRYMGSGQRCGRTHRGGLHLPSAR